MNTEHINRFDELIREKLNSYETEPDMELLVHIHARKNRFLRSRNLYKLIILLAILVAGIIGGYYLNSTSHGNTSSNTDQIPGTKTTRTSSHEPDRTGSPEHADQDALNNYTTTGSEVSNGARTTFDVTDQSPANPNETRKQDNTRPDGLSEDQQSTRATLVSASQTSKAVATSVSEFEQALPVKNSESVKNENHNGKGSGSKNQNGTDDGNTCNIEFDFYTTYDDAFHFIAKAGSSDPIKLTWLFGDGSISNEQSPKHTYQKAGQYPVTLTAYNTKTKCKSETYKLIRVSKGVDLTASLIQGTIFAEATYAAKTKVELLQYHVSTNTFTVVQTTFTNNKGYYEFNEIVAGNYLIKADGFKEYEGTYYGNTAEKEYATNITIFADDYKELKGYDIQLKNTRAVTWNSSVNQDSGSRWMLVLDEYNNPVSTVLVSSNGTLASGAELPQGNYNLVDPSTGKIGGNLNVDPSGSRILPPGISQPGAFKTTELVLMPNPATDQVKVSLSNVSSAPIEVTIINNAGAVVKYYTLSNGSDLNTLNINDLSVGTYYVVVKQNGVTTSNRLVKGMDTSK